MISKLNAGLLLLIISIQKLIKIKLVVLNYLLSDLHFNIVIIII